MRRCSTWAASTPTAPRIPTAKLAASGYYYPIGANRGYVGLASDPALIDAVNKALSELQGCGHHRRTRRKRRG